MNTVTRPDGPSLPRSVHGGMALAAPLWTMRRLRERYGSAFTGARLATMRGMGHDLPRGARPALVNLIDDHIRAGAVKERRWPGIVGSSRAGQ